jgi:hypothetical protein
VESWPVRPQLCLGFVAAIGRRPDREPEIGRRLDKEGYKNLEPELTDIRD